MRSVALSTTFVALLEGQARRGPVVPGRRGLRSDLNEERGSGENQIPTKIGEDAFQACYAYDNGHMQGWKRRLTCTALCQALSRLAVHGPVHLLDNTGGSLLLVIGPWVRLPRLTGAGMILRLAGTAWLLLNVIVP